MDYNLKVLYPKIAEQWHPTKNENLIPDKVAPRSTKKVWWICENGHEWMAFIQDRTKGIGCNQCYNINRSKIQRKAALKRVESLAIKYPDLIKEWHPTKNDLSPYQVTPGSHYKAWWMCKQDQDHIWLAQVKTRSKGHGCPYCSGRLASKENNLLFKFPEIAKEWNFNINKKNPSEYSPNSSQKVWWKCERDHEWPAMIYMRTVRKTGCPVCSGRIPTKENNLLARFPEIAKEWHPIKNKKNPLEYTPYSSQQVWWVCERGHEWPAKISSRTGKGSGCPKCRTGTSKLEIRIYTELKTLFDEVKWRAKIDGYECDLYLSKYKLGIEIDGGYYHDNRREKDKQKGENLREKGITLLRLRDNSLGKIDDSDTLYMYREGHLKTLHKLLKSIMDNYSFSTDEQEKILEYISSGKIRNNREYRNRLSQLPSPPSEVSLQYLYPELSKEWHYEKNAPLEPSMFSPGSEIKVWWICLNDSSHDYSSSIINRVNGSGCPYCPSAKSARQASKGYNLETKYPELTKEWHPTKNLPLKPSDVTPSSNKMVYWRCSKYPEHEWLATPNHRTNMNLGCPYCSGSRVSNLNSIASKFPELAKEWHPIKNGNLIPDQVSFGSTQKIWWKCEKEHEWQAPPNSRSQGRSCPKCAKEKRIVTRRRILVQEHGSLADHYPELIKEWHPSMNGELDPCDFTCGSNEKVWWLCKQGHVWQAGIASRVSGRGCIVCFNASRGKKLEDSLMKNRGSLSDKYPELAAEWHPTKNGDLRAQSVYYGSGKLVWWMDKGGREWQAVIRGRTKNYRTKNR